MCKNITWIYVLLKNTSKRLGKEKIQRVDIQFAKSIHVPARRLIIQTTIVSFRYQHSTKYAFIQHFRQQYFADTHLSLFQNFNNFSRQFYYISWHYSCQLIQSSYIFIFVIHNNFRTYINIIGHCYLKLEGYMVSYILLHAISTRLGLIQQEAAI